MKGLRGHLLNPKSDPSGYTPLRPWTQLLCRQPPKRTKTLVVGRRKLVVPTQDSFGIWVLRCHGNYQQKTTTLIVIVLLKGEGGG